jgi:hypothetical protein
MRLFKPFQAAVRGVGGYPQAAPRRARRAPLSERRTGGPHAQC